MANEQKTQEKEFSLEERASALQVANSIMHHDGYVADENGQVGQIVLKDMLRKEDLLPLMPEAITHVMLEEIEPQSVLYNNFFTQVVAQDTHQSLIIHNMGPLSVQPVGDYGEYPDSNLAMDMSGYDLNLRIRRYGLELRVHEDVVAQNMIPVIGMWLQRARNAFVRNREKLAVQELKKHGIVVYDNNNPAGYSHEVKAYSGRGIDGNANGTMSLNDLMAVYVSALLDGYTVDTIAMNPFAWQTFMVDPEMREIVINNNTVVSYRAPNGSSAFGRFSQLTGPLNLGLPWGKGAGHNNLDPNQSLTGKLGQNPYALTQSILGATYNIGPRYFPTPLTIVVSPFVPLSRIGNTLVTDIIFAQGGEAGVVLKEGDPVVKQFSVEEKEAIVVRMREGLAYGTLNLGKAVRICKNVVVDRNYVFENSNSVTLSAINQSTSQGPF